MTKVRTEKQEKAKLLVSSLRKYPDVMQMLGIKEQQLSELETLSKELAEKDTELEAIRAKASAMSRATSEKETELSSLMTEIKKIVKNRICPTDWLKYGVQDKR